MARKAPEKDPGLLAKEALDRPQKRSKKAARGEL